MKRISIIVGILILVAGIAASLCGCSTGGPAAAADAYRAFIQQQRTYSPVRITAAEGKSLSLSLSGAGSIELGAPLEPLSAMPRDPATWQALLSSAERIALGGLGIWALRDVATQEAPAPTIVEPTIVEVEKLPARRR